MQLKIMSWFKRIFKFYTLHKEIEINYNFKILMSSKKISIHFLN